MRTFHRIGGLVTVLLMLYMAGTGTMMQLLDLKALLRHAPETDPTIRSIEEGKYGNDDFPVIMLRDYGAAALPRGFDYGRAIGTVLGAMHKEDPGAAPTFVELRVDGGVPIGQVQLGTHIDAFNAETGRRVTPIVPKPLPLPQSLRESLKRLHRFWSRRDVPGVYFELLAGIALWMLIITGLVMYFRMLNARAKAKRRNLFWLSRGGLWRSLHRVVSVAAAVFLVAIAFSGTWLGFESVVHSLRVQQGPREGRQANSAGLAVPLRDAEVQDMTTTTLAAMQRLHPETPVKVLRLRVYGQMKQGVVVTGGGETTQLVFNADTGTPATLSDPAYPNSGFPFGTQMHEDIKHFHSGALFGLSTRCMNLFAGLSLLFLSISAMVVYFDIWRKRRRAGRHGLVWQ